MPVSLSAGPILFPTQSARLTSILAVGAFIALAVLWRKWAPVLACLAWAMSFELVFELAEITLGKGDVLGVVHVAWVFCLGVIFSSLAWRAGVRPDWMLLSAALLVFAAWIGAGFHVNQHTMIGFDPAAEVLNEASKMLWAAAFLLPLLRSAHDIREHSGAGSPKPRTRTGADPPSAIPARQPET